MYSTYSNLAFCDIYLLSRAMKQQLCRSLTPAATVATSPEVSDVASDLKASSAHGDYSSAASNIPMTLPHHDGRRVTTRDPAREQGRPPHPGANAAPHPHHPDSELTRNKIYQELSTVSRTSAAATDYSCVDNSIMSIISEVLTVRNVNQSKISLNQTNTIVSDFRFLTGCENIFDTNCLLSTIEEHRAQPRAEERLSFAWPSFSNSSKPPAFAVQSAAVNLVKELMQSKSVVILQDGGAPRPG